MTAHTIDTDVMRELKLKHQNEVDSVATPKKVFKQWKEIGRGRHTYRLVDMVRFKKDWSQFEDFDASIENWVKSR